jgi:hypothetical protein
MADLITTARAQQAPGLASVDATYLATLIAVASTWIESDVNRTFAVTTYTDETYNGDGTSQIWLNQFPIVALTTMKVVESDGTIQTIAGTEFDFNAATGEVHFKRYANGYYVYFPLAFQNIKWTYQAGFATVPADVQDACARLVKWLYDRASKDGTVTSERLDEFGQSFDVKVEEMPTDVRRLIGHYRNVFTSTIGGQMPGRP